MLMPRTAPRLGCSCLPARRRKPADAAVASPRRLLRVQRGSEQSDLPGERLRRTLRPRGLHVRTARLRRSIRVRCPSGRRHAKSVLTRLPVGHRAAASARRSWWDGEGKSLGTFTIKPRSQTSTSTTLWRIRGLPRKAHGEALSARTAGWQTWPRLQLQPMGESGDMALVEDSATWLIVLFYPVAGELSRRKHRFLSAGYHWRRWYRFGASRSTPWPVAICRAIRCNPHNHLDCQVTFGVGIDRRPIPSQPRFAASTSSLFVGLRQRAELSLVTTPRGML